MNRFAALMLAAVIGLIVTTAGALAEKQQVKGYTKKNGTVVQGYTREVKGKSAPEMVEVKGYTKKNGTVVKGYTRRKASK
jgi:hypothetical protein